MTPRSGVSGPADGKPSGPLLRTTFRAGRALSHFTRGSRTDGTVGVPRGPGDCANRDLRPSPACAPRRRGEPLDRETRAACWGQGALSQPDPYSATSLGGAIQVAERIFSLPATHSSGSPCPHTVIPVLLQLYFAGFFASITRPLPAERLPWYSA